LEEKDTVVEEVETEQTQENMQQEQEETSEDVTQEASDEKVVDIESKLEEKRLNEEMEKLEDKYQRIQAEYTNYRRRTQQEKETMGLFANEKILNELIPIVDSMEMALNACNDKEDNVFKGIELVHKQLQSTLEKFGVEEIQAKDCDFDPNLHLAVMQESLEDVEPNKVIMVLQKGYRLGNKVLRASMVKVSC